MRIDRYRVEWQCGGWWDRVDGWYFLLSSAASRAAKLAANWWTVRCFRVVRNRDNRVMMIVVANPRGPKDPKRRRRWTPR